jgi:hypothetical protein
MNVSNQSHLDPAGFDNDKFGSFFLRPKNAASH